MKNSSIAFNVSLALLAGSLIQGCQNGAKKDADSSQPQMSAMNMYTGKQKLIRIAHVNLDTLNLKYQCMLDFKREIESRQNSIQNEIDSKTKIAQDEYAAAAQKKQAGNMSQLEEEKITTDLQQKQAEIENLQRRHDDLIKEAQDRDSKIVDIVDRYVATYNKKYHFDYVMAYAKTGTNILYANDSLDITKDVLVGLNQEYKDSLQKMSSKH